MNVIRSVTFTGSSIFIYAAFEANFCLDLKDLTSCILISNHMEGTDGVDVGLSFEHRSVIDGSIGPSMLVKVYRRPTAPTMNNLVVNGMAWCWPVELFCMHCCILHLASSYIFGIS